MNERAITNLLANEYRIQVFHTFSLVFESREEKSIWGNKVLTSENKILCTISYI